MTQVILYTTVFKNASIFYFFLRISSIFSVVPMAQPGIQYRANLLHGFPDTQKPPVQARSAIKHFFHTCLPAFSLHRHSPLREMAINYYMPDAGERFRGLLSSYSDKFVDRIPALRKLLLILCHNIIFVHFFIMMQIISKCLQCPCGLFDLLQ